MNKIEFVEWQGQKYDQILDFHEGMAAVRDAETKLWGFIDEKFYEVISCQYADIHNFSDSVCAVCDKGTLKWGFIDKNGNTVIDFLYFTVIDFHEGMGAVSLDNKKFKFISLAGDFVYEHDCANISACSCGKMVCKSLENKIFTMTKNGHNALPYLKLTDFNNNKAVGLLKTSLGYELCLINEGYRTINSKKLDIADGDFVRIRYEDGIILLSFDSKYALFDEQFNQLTGFIYCNIEEFDNGVALANVLSDSLLHGVVDKSGKFMVYPNFKYSIYLNLSEGLIGVIDRKTNLWGFIDVSGEEVIPCKFKSVHPFHSGLASVVTEDGRISYIDKNGNIVFTPGYTYYASLEFNGEVYIVEAPTEYELGYEKIELLSFIKDKMNESLESIQIDTIGNMYDMVSSEIERERLLFDDCGSVPLPCMSRRKVKQDKKGNVTGN